MATDFPMQIDLEPEVTPTTPYATTAQVATFTGIAVGDLPTNMTRLLARASELIDSAIRGGLDTTDTDQVTACQNAVCAQIEWWIEVGESRETEGTIQGYTMGRLQVQYGAGDNRIAPLYLAPRATRFLFLAGLLYSAKAMA